VVCFLLLQLFFLFLQVGLSLCNHVLQSDHLGFKTGHPFFAPFLLQFQLLTCFQRPFGSLFDLFFQFAALLQSLLKFIARHKTLVVCGSLLGLVESGVCGYQWMASVG